MSVVDKVINARAALLTMAPFYGVLSSRLRVVEDPTCKDMWTDSKTLGVNPKYVESLSKLELQAVMCKLVMQLSAGHGWRRGGRDARLWNLASTYAVLDGIETMGVLYPGKLKSRPEFVGQSAEGIYYALMEEEQENQKDNSSTDPSSPSGEKGEGEGGSGTDGSEGGAPGDESKEGSGSPTPSEDKSPEGQPSSNPGAGQGAGSESQGEAEPGEIRDAPVSDENGDCQDEWNSAVRHAATLQGNLPGSFVLQLKSSLVKPLPWKSVLKHFARKLSGRTKYSFAKPNRNHLHRGIILPGKAPKRRLGTVVIARDTSGSIAGSPYLGMFNAAIEEFIKDMNPENVYVLDIDSTVQKVQRVVPDKHEKLEQTAKGGGGTSFKPAFEWVKVERIHDVACLIYLTDMMGTFPEAAPSYPVLWVKTDLVLTNHYKAPFGQELVLTAD